MNVTRIASRYAKALFKLSGGDLTAAKGRLEALKVVDELFADKEAGKVLRSPVMPGALKNDLINYALDLAKADQGLYQFFKMIGDSRRIAMVPEITQAFSKLINDAAGIIEADVSSAVALPEDDLRSVSEMLGKIFHKDVIVKLAVDRSLLGGVLVRAGNYRIDMSLKTKLNGLAQNAAQASL